MKIEFINKRLKIVSYLLKSSFFIILNFFFPPGNMRQIFSKIQKWVGSKILLLYCIVASVTQGNSINIHTEVARIQNLELPNITKILRNLHTLSSGFMKNQQSHCGCMWLEWGMFTACSHNNNMKRESLLFLYFYSKSHPQPKVLILLLHTYVLQSYNYVCCVFGMIIHIFILFFSLFWAIPVLLRHNN
jgi:hypothetical protein